MKNGRGVYLLGNITESMLVIATYLWYLPCFFSLASEIAFATSLLAVGITSKGRLWERGALGLGRPS